MMWCVAVVAAAVSAVASGQGQIVSYDGTTLVNDNTQPEVIVQVPSSAPVPATTFARSFGFAPAPAPAQVPAAQPAVIVQSPTSFPTFVPPLQPTFGPVAAPVAPQFGIPQGGLPVLPACPSTYSLVHATYHGSLYHFSWCYYQSGQRFTHQQAADYCRTLNHFGHPYNFEVLRMEDTIEVSFINYLLSYYAHAAVWTKDTTSTAPYSIRSFINRSGVNRPGHDCLSVETAFFALHSIWVHENSCSDAKLVVCEARY
ncbi:uncharacterized protein LOC135089123 [Scylla paramamosain]|uniref:uncharacterized protein LOC135089123 n=1 Tax=Scylla paramamosain TaxID=85552 RepID=UPI003082C27D